MGKKPHLPFDGGMDLSKIVKPPPPRTGTVTTFRSCQMAFEFEIHTYDGPAECKIRIIDHIWNAEYHLGFPESEIDALIGLLEGMKREIGEKKEVLREAGDI